MAALGAALAGFQDVHDALDIRAIIFLDDAEIEMHQLAGLHLEIGGGGVAHRAFGAGVHRGAMQGFPGWLQAAFFEFGVHEGGNLALGFADFYKGKGLRIDLFGGVNGFLYPAQFFLSLAAAHSRHNVFRADQPVRVGTADIVAQDLVHPVGKPIGKGVVPGGVDRDLFWRQAGDGLAQNFADGLVIVEHLGISTRVAGGIGLEMAHDGDAFAAAADEQGGLPGKVGAEKKRQHGVAASAGLSHKGDPQIDTLFGQYANRLFDLFAD